MSTPNEGINGTFTNNNWYFSLDGEDGIIGLKQLNDYDPAQYPRSEFTEDKDGKSNGAIIIKAGDRLQPKISMSNIMSLSFWYYNDSAVLNSNFLKTTGNTGFISKHSVQNQIVFNIGTVGTTDYTLRWSDPIDVPADSWFNIIMIIDDAASYTITGHMKIYINGVLKISTQIFHCDIGTISLGGVLNPETLVDNKYDELRLFNGIWTDAQVAEIQTMGVNYPLLKCETPVATPSGGSYTEAQIVELTCLTPDAKIYYTTNGISPDDNATLYSQPIEISENTILKAIAYATGFAPSDILTETYSITYPLETITIEEEFYDNSFDLIKLNTDTNEVELFNNCSVLSIATVEEPDVNKKTYNISYTNKTKYNLDNFYETEE